MEEEEEEVEKKEKEEVLLLMFVDVFSSMYCTVDPVKKSHGQCMPSHRNPIDGVYCTAAPTHMGIRAKGNIVEA